MHSECNDTYDILPAGTGKPDRVRFAPEGDIYFAYGHDEEISGLFL